MPYITEAKNHFHIMDMKENCLSHRETVREYWNTQNRTEEDKYLHTLINWERIYLEKGAPKI